MVFGTGMLSIFLNFRKRRDMFAMYHQERMAAIEKGIELPALPEDFFIEDGKRGRVARPSGHGTLLAGLILGFLGLTLYLALHCTVPRTETGGDPALYALIPSGLGVACLIYYFSVGLKAAAALAAERQARLAEAARGNNPPA
jgi:hypothetical protein